MRRLISLAALHRAKQRCVIVEGELRGTGVIIESGLVVTNFHLIENIPDPEIIVDGQPVTRVIDVDFRFDLATLIVPTPELKPVVVHDCCYPTQKIFYVGNPGEKVKAIQLGRIVRTKIGRLDIEVECDNGFSGSGVYNSRGDLIGITDSFDPEGNMGYAVPGGIIKEYLGLVRRKLAVTG